MLKETNTNSRSSFIRKASLALVSVLGIGIGSISLKKSQVFSAYRVNALSNNEANEIIKNMPLQNSEKVKPELPPKSRKKSANERISEN